MTDNNKKPCVIPNCDGMMTRKTVPPNNDTAWVDPNNDKDARPQQWPEGMIPNYEAWFCETGEHVQLV
jgi:hypothetical protein